MASLSVNAHSSPPGEGCFESGEVTVALEALEALSGSRRLAAREPESPQRFAIAPTRLLRLRHSFRFRLTRRMVPMTMPIAFVVAKKRPQRTPPDRQRVFGSVAPPQWAEERQ